MKETYIHKSCEKILYNFLCFSGGKFFNHQMYYGENMYISPMRNFQ